MIARSTFYLLLVISCLSWGTVASYARDRVEPLQETHAEDPVDSDTEKDEKEEDKTESDGSDDVDGPVSEDEEEKDLSENADGPTPSDEALAGDENLDGAIGGKAAALGDGIEAFPDTNNSLPGAGNSSPGAGEGPGTGGPGAGNGNGGGGFGNGGQFNPGGSNNPFDNGLNNQGQFPDPRAQNRNPQQQPPPQGKKKGGGGGGGSPSSGGGAPPGGGGGGGQATPAQIPEMPVAEMPELQPLPDMSQVFAAFAQGQNTSLAPFMQLMAGMNEQMQRARDRLSSSLEQFTANMAGILQNSLATQSQFLSTLNSFAAANAIANPVSNYPTLAQFGGRNGAFLQPGFGVPSSIARGSTRYSPFRRFRAVQPQRYQRLPASYLPHRSIKRSAPRRRLTH